MKKTKLINLEKAILSLETKNEVTQFLRDLLTTEEIAELSRRWQTAQMLNNNITYQEIEKQTGLSSTTIARVSKCLKNASGGYRKVLNKFDSHHHRSSSAEKGL